MCGRFTFVANPEEVMEEYQLDEPFEFPVRYNIAPTQQVLAIVNDGDHNRAGLMNWGLVPSWSKDRSIGSKMINARLETADQKPSYKRLMSRRRCLIVADSFYEWKKGEDGKKQPYRISLKDRHLFAFAGLWDRWSQGDDELVTCTILTKDANDFMSNLHHRMPVILPKSEEQNWLDFDVKDPTEMKEFLFEMPHEELTAYEVDQRVNNPKNDDESCVQSIVE
ncbi:SOS response-associated peptidase [Aquisalibacillus elongatus]|uniref:Abasic site processing protein n=1 Tax=Aquisalibacillus elongatus TaxID=485577 RepID=A0A3N5AZZ2_9BACI|nr:SOS response-associated peptidase [Aquisalibacillus elongatus]RPF50577.1 putative SOS response-associated peptidase YedK [Aquisalibacillus elongatus]